MKRILKALLFTLYSMIMSYILVKGIDFGTDFTKNFLLFTTGLFLLNLFMKSILDIISLPTHGVMYFLISALLNVALFFIQVTYIPDLHISSTTNLNLNFGLDMLPSYELKDIPTVLLSGLVFTLFYRILYWVSGSKR